MAVQTRERWSATAAHDAAIKSQNNSFTWHSQQSVNLRTLQKPIHPTSHRSSTTCYAVPSSSHPTIVPRGYGKIARRNEKR